MDVGEWVGWVYVWMKLWVGVYDELEILVRLSEPSRSYASDGQVHTH